MKKTLARIIAIALVMVSILTVCATAFAVTGISANSTAVTTKEARLRESADKSSTALATLSKGKEVTILTSTNTYHGWYKVRYNGKTGYIREDFLKKKTESSTPAYQSTYGTKNFSYGCAMTDKEKVQWTAIINDLKKWAKETEDPYKTEYSSGKYMYDNYNCFRNLSGHKFDDNADYAVELFQQLTPVLAVDHIVGPKTKQALWNETH